MIGFGHGTPMLFGAISYLAIIVGIILLVIWSVKHLNGDQMKKAGMWCVFAGVALLFLATLASVRFSGNEYSSRRGSRATQTQKAIPNINFR